MARIAGVDIPPRKRVVIGLTHIFGIGRSRSAAILEEVGVDLGKKVGELTDEETTRIRQLIDQQGNVEGDLRKKIQMDIRRLIEIGCYRGLRHRRGLPAHGQRTHTNARTRKGPRRATVPKKKPTGKK